MGIQYAIRAIVLVTTGAITALGCWALQLILTADGTLGWLDAGTLALFAALAAWIGFSFSLTVVGLARQLRLCVRRPKTGQGAMAEPFSSEVPAPAHRTAVLMPVYNESPTAVMAGVAAMADDFARRGLAESLDIFVLSDSTDPETWLREEWLWERLCDAEPESAGDPPRPQIFYRHRTNNTQRKAGNIAEFCEKWGSDYEYMLVLDADSLMTSDTVAEMIRRADRDPRVGILQVPPQPVGRQSLLARWQQFSAALYGPTFATGLCGWAGDQGNYWGHNALIRIAPFMAHCALPTLPGKPPLGGDILSHDFVEAALLVRNGWKVQLAGDLEGSYEESPTTLRDFLVRDQRWCQGNLQHWQLMLAEGMHPISRAHFATGILSYVAASLWMMFLALTIAVVLLGDSAIGAGASRAAPLAAGLFVASMTLLLLPKLFAVLTAVADSSRRASLGGAGSIIAGVLVETALSVFIAPVIAVFHCRFVWSTLRGHRVVWATQNRDEQGVSWSQAGRDQWPVTALGLIAAGTLSLTQPTLLIWFSPILVAWLAAIPLAVALGSIHVGSALRRVGLFLIPHEREPLVIVTAQQRWQARLATAFASEGCGDDSEDPMYTRLVSDPNFLRSHLDILTAAGNQQPVSDETAATLARCDAGAPRAVPPEHRRAVLSDENWVRTVGKI